MQRTLCGAARAAKVEAVRVPEVSTPPSNGVSSLLTRVRSVRWWLHDKDGSLTLGQWPNPALSVWLVAVVVGRAGVFGAARTSTLADVGRGALIVWALDELVRGASPFRRLLGAVVLVVQLVGLFA